MNARSHQPREFTGRHMLIITVSFFAVVIAVNFTLAYFAESSWTGLVVENSYVASQEFNEKAREGREQAALGWTGKLQVTGGEVSYGLTSRGGDPIRLDGVTVLFRHPAYDTEDERVELKPGADGRWAAGTRRVTACGSSRSTPRRDWRDPIATCSACMCGVESCSELLRTRNRILARVRRERGAFSRGTAAGGPAPRRRNAAERPFGAGRSLRRVHQCR